MQNLKTRMINSWLKLERKNENSKGRPRMLENAIIAEGIEKAKEEATKNNH